MTSQTLYQNTQFSIFLKDKPQDDSDKFILAEWNNFVIPKQGIYTVEGKNRAGKSILIKMIMGVLPPSIEGTNEQSVSINGKSLNITKVKDAYKNGLVSVFQDDTLIPTMTIREQYYLRHASKHTLLNYFFSFYYSFYTIFAKGFVEHSLGLLIPPINKLVHFFEPKKERYLPESTIDPEIDKWFLKFEMEKDILSKYPSQLSGGTIAKVRIISALLTKNIEILFLDEALNAVAKSDCYKIIDIIKNWAINEEIKRTIVVVTHKQDEVFRWQPDERFIIEDKKIKPVNAFEYDGLDSGIQFNNKFITKFKSLAKSKEYLSNLKRPILVIIDKKIETIPAINDLLNFIGMRGRNKECGFFSIAISEQTKSLEEFTKLIPEVVSFLPKVEGTIILIGGGTLLNFGSFIAATLHRGLIEHIVVPTTLMALADVAIGSKASLNIEINKNGLSQKHILGTYANPAAVIMDESFIAALSEDEKLNGLSECLKHGLLQDKNLYDIVISLIKQTNPDVHECFNVGIKTQELKSRTLIVDPFENDYGRVLLFGHLHAHSLERVKELRIPHGISVFWGILLDLKLGGNQIIYNEVLTTIKNSKLKPIMQTVSSSISSDNVKLEKLQNIYNTDTKLQHYQTSNKFNILKLNDIAEYSYIPTQLKNVIVTWEEIITAIYEIRDQLK